MKTFEGKTAVITGAGGTICSQIAIDLASRGVKVALVGRSIEKLERVESVIKENGGVCKCYSCDVTNEEQVFELSKKVTEELGVCNYLINGAGGNDPAAMPNITKFDMRELSEDRPEDIKGFFNVDMKSFEKVLLTNTMGTVYPTKAFGALMAKNGGGSVINFASMNSYCPLTRCFSYAMSKAAIVNLTQSLAAYFAPAGIRINAIAPGFIVNERSKKYLGTVEDGLTPRGNSVISHTPMERFGQASDICGAVRFLLDEEGASFVTGITVPVDGGFLTLGGV